jgi:hypothetical protein
MRRTLVSLSFVVLLSGCSSVGTFMDMVTTAGPATTRIPEAGALIPDGTVHISPSVAMSIEKMVFWGAYAGVAYMVLDPLAPNWDIEQAAFPDSHYHFSLKMKRVYAGGSGEARVVFQQRAKDLMRQGSYDSYDILEYSEGLDSSVLGSQRVASGVIRLVRK